MAADWWPLRTASNVHVIVYEDAFEKPAQMVSGLAEFLGLDLSQSRQQTILELTKFTVMKGRQTTMFGPNFPFNQENFIHKGGCGGWKQLFTPEQILSLDQKYDKGIRDHQLPIRYN